MQLHGLVQRLQQDEWNGWDVLRWKMLPEPLMHVFASDCVARMALHEEAFGEGLHARFWDLLNVKRKWVAEIEDSNTLQEAREQARQLGRTWGGLGHHGESRGRLLQGLVWSLLNDPLRAALSTSVLEIKFAAWHLTDDAEQKLLRWEMLDYELSDWDLHKEREEAWQHRRILWLCEAWNLCGVRTPWLLWEDDLPFLVPQDAALDFALGQES
jgi:hypothetical protein